MYDIGAKINIFGALFDKQLDTRQARPGKLHLQHLKGNAIPETYRTDQHDKVPRAGNGSARQTASEGLKFELWVKVGISLVRWPTQGGCY